jgi:hypothetical protein
MTATQHRDPEATRFHDPRLVELYKLIAMRFWMRFVDARANVEHYGGGILREEDLGANEHHADLKYEAAADSALIEQAGSAAETLALIEFAGVLAADRLIGEVLNEPVNDFRDAYQQSRALANAALFVNDLANQELVEQERAKLAGGAACKSTPTAPRAWP